MNDTSIALFAFGESTIRTTTRDSEPWFVIADLCKALEHSNPTMMMEKLHPEDLSTAEVFTQTGAKIVNICNESGLYSLIFQSRKPAAQKFTRWVTSEVLPTIRKKGYYSRHSEQILSFARELMAMGFTSKDASILTRTAFPPMTRTQLRMQELEQENSEAIADPEGDLFVSIMLKGVEYRVKDFFASLPAGHRILKIKSPKGRDTAIGTVMERLRRQGRVSRVNARFATFELTKNNIVSIQH